MDNRIEELLKNIERNNMKPFYAENKAEAVSIVRSLLKTGDTISCGGSVTLSECGITELMESGEYDFLDRRKVETSEEKDEIYRKTFFADAFLTSCNAITEKGVLYNVDGHSNRVAAIAFGPKSVIVVAGVNKIVKDMDAAIMRVKTVAAPKNAVRLSAATYCEAAGKCSDTDGEMCDGCRGRRMCSNYLVSAYQGTKDRIKVIIVNENLGY